MEAVARGRGARTADFGIELIDVRIKRADLPGEVQQSVFARMVSERGRIAKRYRSEGEEEAAKLRAETDKQREIILAQPTSAVSACKARVMRQRRRSTPTPTNESRNFMPFCAPWSRMIPF